MQEILIRSLDQEDLLEEEMTTHSSIPAWESLWLEEPGGLLSLGLQRHQIRLKDFTATTKLQETGNIANYSCP